MARILNNAQLYVVTNNQDALVNITSYVEDQIEIFTKKKQALVKRPVTISKLLQDIQLKIHITDVLRKIAERKKTCFKKHSKQRPINQKKKVSHKDRFNFDQKTKAILKYIRQEIKYHRRHCIVSLYRQQKRFRLEYRQKKIFGRQRDRSKARHVRRAKRKFSANRHERKFLNRYKHTTTYGLHSKISNIPVIKKINTAQLKSKKPSRSHFSFPEKAISDARSLVCHNEKITLRYTNQHLFIYSQPMNSCYRPSKKYLIKVVSTIDDFHSELSD